MDDINKLNETGGAGDWGTDKARAKLQKDTPGQKIIRGNKMKFKDLLQRIDESSASIEESTQDYVNNVLPKALKKAGINCRPVRKAGYTSYDCGNGYEIVNDGVGIKVKKDGKEVDYYSKPRLDYKKAVAQVSESQIAEEKQFAIKVPKGGPRGKDLIQKVSGKDQKDAVAKFRKQHPRLKNDMIDVVPLATLKRKGDRYAFSEEEQIAEAMSEKDKKKRLAMIKRAVEKINKSNAEKAKKDALAMMKASGMFDEDLDEVSAPNSLEMALEIKVDLGVSFEKGALRRTDAEELRREWDLYRLEIRKVIKPLGGLVIDQEAPSPKSSTGGKRIGTMTIGTRGDTSKFDPRKIKAALSRNVEVNDMTITKLD